METARHFLQGRCSPVPRLWLSNHRHPSSIRTSHGDYGTREFPAHIVMYALGYFFPLQDRLFQQFGFLGVVSTVVLPLWVTGTFFVRWRTRTSLATMIAGARQPGQRARAGSGPVRFLERVPETYLSLTREPAAAGQVRQHEEAAG